MRNRARSICMNLNLRMVLYVPDVVILRLIKESRNILMFARVADTLNQLHPTQFFTKRLTDLDTHYNKLYPI